MSVYVDPLFCFESRNAQAFRVGARHGHQWCHLFADSVAELHAMARKIGMKRAWFQDKRMFPHYDLVPPRRAAAIAAGAIELSHRDAVAWFQARKNLILAVYRFIPIHDFVQGDSRPVPPAVSFINPCPP